MKKYDERNVLFSRITLKENTKVYDDYYHNLKDQKQKDDEIRNISFRENLKKDQKFKDLFLPLSKNNKVIIKSFHEASDNFTVKEKQNIKPSFAKNIKEITKYFGAIDVGIAKLNEDSFYSHSGGLSESLNIDNYAIKIKANYQYAIVFTVLMKKEYINRAPFFEELLATELAYYEVASIASRLSIYLKSIGYDAFMNSSEHYLAPLVPLAYDAGLGEIGMSNHLVTKKYGDNVRLGAVFTNLKLDIDSPIDFGLSEFCKKCALCMMNCPSGSITHKKRIVNNRPFYKFDDASCFSVWTNTGTDCGVCIQSCPFTQGVDQELVNKMKDNESVMETIFNQHMEKYGRRVFDKKEIDLLKVDE